MELFTYARSRFRLGDFLSALHRFALTNGGLGNPLSVVVGTQVVHDAIELAEALADESEEVGAIPDDSRARLEAGLTLFAPFTMFDGFVGLDCADGSRARVREDEADECLTFGFVFSLVGDTVEIEGRELSDVTGDSELRSMSNRDRIGNRMRRWVRTFVSAKHKKPA